VFGGVVRARFADPLLVGVLGAAVSLVGAGRPSFWYDEAATISAAYSRSVGQLWQMLGNVDAVHGLYYLLMHGWFAMVPPTESWSRVPSALGVGAAAAAVVVLGKQHSSRTVAVCAGVVCAILPRATWAGIEARPYALSMMAAAWLTVLLVAVARRNTWWLWSAYAVALAVAVVFDIYLALMVLAHLAWLLFGRKSLAPFGIAVVAAGLAVAPFGLRVVGQAHQIVWIAPVGRRTVEDVAIQQYFERSPLFTLVAAVIVVAAVAIWRFGAAACPGGDRPQLVLAIAWMVLPTPVIVGWSAVLHTIYTPR
jgi:mannosyltransferase